MLKSLTPLKVSLDFECQATVTGDPYRARNRDISGVLRHYYQSKFWSKTVCDEYRPADTYATQHYDSRV
jgi:hypothetical protein